MAGDAIYLVMDMINDLVHEDGKAGYGPELARIGTIENTVAALRRAREAGVHIGYVRIGFSPDYRECPPNSPVFSGARKAGRFKLGTWGTQVHPTLAPQPGDFDIVKHRVSPFYCTDLEVILRANGIRRLFLSGVSTGGVVQSGTRDGHDRDYAVSVIEDCCAAPTAEQHAAMIDGLRRYARVTTAAEVDFT